MNKPILSRAAEFHGGLAGLLLLALLSTACADDWPQWMGPQRDGVWREKKILQKFPESGLQILWRTNVNRGYCGPAVAAGRLFMMDRQPGPPLQVKARGQKTEAGGPKPDPKPAAAGNERVFCLDASTGQQIWEHIYDCPYRIGYPSGPRATPVVAGGRVYTLGAMGDLLCLGASDGKVIWLRSASAAGRRAADLPGWRHEQRGGGLPQRYRKGTLAGADRA